MLTFAATAQADRGWGNVSALIGAAVVFWLFTVAYRRWKQAPESSPTTAALPSVEGFKPQLSAGVDPSDPADDPSRPALGASVAGVGSNRVTVPPAPRPAPAATGGTDLDTWVAGQIATQRRPVEIIREAGTRFGRSQATVKRAIKRARTGTRREVTS